MVAAGARAAAVIVAVMGAKAARETAAGTRRLEQGAVVAVAELEGSARLVTKATVVEVGVGGMVAAAAIPPQERAGAEAAAPQAVQAPTAAESRVAASREAAMEEAAGIQRPVRAATVRADDSGRRAATETALVRTVAAAAAVWEAAGWAAEAVPEAHLLAASAGEATGAEGTVAAAEVTEIRVVEVAPEDRLKAASAGRAMELEAALAEEADTPSEAQAATVVVAIRVPLVEEAAGKRVAVTSGVAAREMATTAAGVEPEERQLEASAATEREEGSRVAAAEVRAAQVA